MEPEEKKKTNKKKEVPEDDHLEKEEIPTEDVDMIREKNDPNANSAYIGDNSFDDER
jgi:hypothetical protein